MIVHGRDRGAAEAYGLVLIAPAAIGLALLAVALGRGVDARAQVRSAAESAAQAAALERTPGEARAAADAAASAILLDSSSCQSFELDVDYPTAPSGAGTSFGLVTVRLACSVSDQGIEAVQQGARTEAVTAVAAVDLFRARP